MLRAPQSIHTSAAESPSRRRTLVLSSPSGSNGQVRGHTAKPPGGHYHSTFSLVSRHLPRRPLLTPPLSRVYAAHRLSYEKIDYTGQRVLIRVDFNVPQVRLRPS